MLILRMNILKMNILRMFILFFLKSRADQGKERADHDEKVADIKNNLLKFCRTEVEFDIVGDSTFCVSFEDIARGAAEQ